MIIFTMSPYGQKDTDKIEKNRYIKATTQT